MIYFNVSIDYWHDAVRKVMPLELREDNCTYNYRKAFEQQYGCEFVTGNSFRTTEENYTVIKLLLGDYIYVFININTCYNTAHDIF